MSFTSLQLGLDVRDGAIARRSSKVAPWQVEIVRDIRPEDLSLLASPADHQNSVAPLAKIREPHHMLAQFVAAGKPRVEISALTGYSPARIATLERDPAFMELVAHYNETNIMASADIEAQIKHVGMSASQILMERMEVDPDQFSNKELMDLRNSSLDRVGHGPSSNHNHNVNIRDTAKIIEALVSQSSNEAASRVISKTDQLHQIEASYVETTPSQGLEIGGDDAEGPVAEGPET